MKQAGSEFALTPREPPQPAHRRPAFRKGRLLVACGKGVVGHARFAHTGQQIGLKARALADDRMNRLEFHHLFVAGKPCALAHGAIEREAHCRHAARCRPGVGDLVATLVLSRGSKDHARNAGKGIVERLVEQFVVMPGISSGNPPTIILGGPAVNARALSNAAMDEVESASWDFEIVADAGGNFASLVAGVAHGQASLPPGIVPNPRSQLIIATRQRIPDYAGTNRLRDGAWPDPLLLDRRLFATRAGPYEPQQTRAHGSVVEAHVVMSRGCDWNCTFCTERKEQSGGEQRRTVAAISAELQELARRHKDLRIQFIDDNLLPQIATRESGDRGRRGQDLDWAERFLDELTRIRSNAEGRFGWRGIFRVEDFLAYEREIPGFLARLAQSGCRMLAFGIEHGDEERRQRMKVGQSATNAEFTLLFQRLSAASIHTKGPAECGTLRKQGFETDWRAHLRGFKCAMREDTAIIRDGMRTGGGSRSHNWAKRRATVDSRMICDQRC